LLNIDYDIEPSLNLFVCNNVYDVGYYIDNAIKLNPIICGVNVEKRLAEEGVKLARAALLPEIVAMGAASIYNYQVSNMLPRWFVGVGLNVTLFDGLAKERRLRAAKATAIGIDNMVENTKSDIVLIVEKEYFNMLNEKQNIDAVERSVTFADEYYHTVYSAFIEGVMLATDVTTAQVELSVAKVEYLNAAYNYCVSLAKLLAAAGLASTFSDYVENGKYIDID
jgi:outer membrane protein TolC